MRGMFKKWWKNEEATAAIEAGFMFPLLMVILCGTVDTGIGLITNMKVTNATQTVSDLLTRDVQVTPGMINDAVIAGEMAMMPYTLDSFGVDIVGIQYIGLSKTPTVIWRRTQNMAPNVDVLTRAEDLGDQNEGIIAVTVRYEYHPLFTSYFAGTYVMTEESYARPRKGGFIPCSTGGSTC